MMVYVWCPQCAELHAVKKRVQREPFPITTYDTECGIMLFPDEDEIIHSSTPKVKTDE